MKFPFFNQLDSYDCGPTCLKMISSYYGKKVDLENLRESSFITRNGVSLLGISQSAETLGYRTLIASLDIKTLILECPLPAILHWNQDHFVVLYKVKKKLLVFDSNDELRNYKFLIADPAHGVQYVTSEVIEKCWVQTLGRKGSAMFLEPTSAFYSPVITQNHSGTWLPLIKYLRPFKKQLISLFLYLLLSTSISISFPFINQNLVDRGILSKNHDLVTLFILAQLVLFFSGTILEILRSWLMLHMTSKISLHIVSDFLKKLMSLPIRFFDSKSVGDISQRINDHHRIESFLTDDLTNTVFSAIQIVILSIILFYFNFNIGITFVLLSFIGIAWIFLFQEKRRKMDYIRFIQNKTIQEKLFELVAGMQEIKLNGSEDTKRWDWEYTQQKLYRLNIKSLSLEQTQQSGFLFFSYLKNIALTYLSAIFVLNNTFSFGTMLSVSYIIGQTNSPLEQIVRFFKSAQNAKLSFSRLMEVQKKESEETKNEIEQGSIHHSLSCNDLVINNVSFQYQGPRSPYILKDLDMTIKHGRITAIVGKSGSGKTTLLKLLLGFYKPVSGEILLGNEDLSSMSPKWWRSKCGTVMQDGYIFSETIAKNIVLDGKEIDLYRFKSAAKISGIDEFVNELPLRYDTRIGANGTGLSGGQKQRILIARAVYKNPDFIFLDEATSSLDASNEKNIIKNLNTFFKGKTVVIVAHRLSTIRNADNIIVLERGRIIESGNHSELIALNGSYFSLIRNQMDFLG